MESKLYTAIFNHLEGLNQRCIINGDVISISKELTKIVAIEMLSKQQRKIYDQLPDSDSSAVYLSFISNLTGLGSKNISSQIKNIQSKFNLIGVIKEGKNFKYYKL
ncbi:hypothetical protein ACR79R_20195 [Sphingobacterium spiritivorum]|uniref:hypothetical protein n=1 Tax=Sphingobacterium spiritivorum TaxID=258 RepID=UPI003DA4F04D